ASSPGFQYRDKPQLFRVVTPVEATFFYRRWSHNEWDGSACGCASRCDTTIPWDDGSLWLGQQHRLIFRIRGARSVVIHPILGGRNLLAVTIERDIPGPV